MRFRKKSHSIGLRYAVIIIIGDLKKIQIQKKIDAKFLDHHRCIEMQEKKFEN